MVSHATVPMPVMSTPANAAPCHPSVTLPVTPCMQASVMTDTSSKLRELLKLLKHHITLPADAKPDNAALKQITKLSTAALAAFSTDGAAAAAVAGPHRDQLLQLLFNIVKAVEAGGFRDIDYEDAQHGDAWCIAAARTAAAVLAAQHGSASNSAGTSGSTSSNRALADLAWLVLFGRCCRCLFTHLQKSETSAMFFPPGHFASGGNFLPQGRPGVDWYRLWEGCPGVFIAKPLSKDADWDADSADAGADSAGANADSAAADAESASADSPAAAAETASSASSSSSSSPQFAPWLAALTAWLQDSATSAQLEAAGLSTERLLPVLQTADLTLSNLQHLEANSPMQLMGNYFTLSLGDEGDISMQDEHHAERDKQLGVMFLQSLGNLEVTSVCSRCHPGVTTRCAGI